MRRGGDLRLYLSVLMSVLEDDDLEDEKKKGRKKSSVTI